MLTAPIVSIVDDDESVRTSIGSLVRSMGWQVRLFDSADAFLQSGVANTTACLISDVQMPGMSGAQMQVRLIETGQVPPIIFITAFPTDAVKAQLLANGALAILTKPLDPSAMSQWLEAVLGAA